MTNDINELEVIKDLISNTIGTKIIKDHINNFNLSYMQLSMTLNSIQEYEQSNREPDEEVGSQYLFALTVLDKSYDDLKQNVGDEIRKIKGKSA